MSHPSDTPHSSHVESRSRKALRSYIIQASTLLEIVLSGLVLIGLLLSFIPLLKWMPGLLFDGNDVEIRGFLERALDIVIGVEFIKMLAKKMTREKRIPFEVSMDPFYSASNMAALNDSIEEMRQGKTVTRTLEELEAMEHE